jgi:hypothetical protein
MNDSSSIIESYPPNINKFPKFYNCKEYTYILHPGDMLFIPKNWFHWVFSYPDTSSKLNTNIGLSFSTTQLTDFNTIEEKPHLIKLNNYQPLNITYQTLLNIYKHDSKTHLVCKSKTHTLIPIIKPGFHNKMKIHDITFNKFHTLANKHTYNLYMAQNCNIFDKSSELHIKPPEYIFKHLPTSKFKCYLWLSSCKNNNSYIESGLHFDPYHNFMIQIQGTKIVRLYHPNDIHNLYIEPMPHRLCS